MISRSTYRLAMALVVVISASGQNFDNSANGKLKGDYFIREVLINGQNTNATITSAGSVVGVATFDGNGNYSFKGQATNTGAIGTVTTQSFSGVYQAAANGLLVIQSFVDGSQNCYGGISDIGPAAFVLSATEGSAVDMLVGIPAGANASAASLKGAYTTGYMDFLNADINVVRQGMFTLNPDGAGNMGNVAVTGNAVNIGAGNQTSQTVNGVTYTLTGNGSGTLNMGTAAATQLISGARNLYTSADGNIILAATPGGYDMVVGLRGLTAPASNATSNGLYFVGGIEDFVSAGTPAAHGIDAFYGSLNANGKGVSITHNRFQSFAQAVFDFTFDNQYTVPASGSFSDGGYYQMNLGAGGKGFVATGTQGLYSLTIGLASPQYTGTGVFLNPTGIVNAASFAPITNPVAPNEIVTLFGTGLAASTVQAATVPLPTTLGNVQVTVNGQAAPLFYVTPGQIALLVPQSVTPASQIFNATFQVTNNGVKSNPVTVYTALTSPGVFSAGGNAIGPALAQHASFSLINTSNPAKAGETIVLYAAGLGGVTPTVMDGAAAPSNPPSTVNDTDFVDFGGTDAIITFAGLTPGLAGLYQLNTTIGSGTPTGDVFAEVSTPDAFTSEATINVAAGTAAKAISATNRGLARRRAPAPDALAKKPTGLSKRAVLPGAQDR